MHVLLGENYRKEWALPVKMPVLNIRKVHGGLAIIKEGGGLHTKSLTMVSADGTNWVLRTADKNVAKVLKPKFRNTTIEVFAQDMISATYPYGALVTAGLLKTLAVTAPDPTLFYVPDDPVLGPHRADFAGQVCFLEEHHPIRPNTQPESSKDLLEELEKNNNIVVLQKEVLKARLLDMLIADWDRHAGQWRWGKYDSSGTTYYYPVPVDRDQAFFHTNGLLMKFITLVGTPYLQGFRENLNGFRSLNYWAWDFDRVFLNELSAADWKEVIKTVQCELGDSAIKLAIDKLPPEVAAIDGDRIFQTLKRRRDRLLPAAMKYYLFLASDVYINAPLKPELFKISTSGEALDISIYSCMEGKEKCEIYQRTILNNETKRIHIVGMGKEDKIETSGDKLSRVKLIQTNQADTTVYDPLRKMLARLRANK